MSDMCNLKKKKKNLRLETWSEIYGTMTFVRLYCCLKQYQTSSINIHNIEHLFYGSTLDLQPFSPFSIAYTRPPRVGFLFLHEGFPKF